MRDWPKKLDDALQAYKTTYKTPIGTTLYRSMYGKMCHFLVVNLVKEKRNVKLIELEEWHLLTYKNVKICKKWSKRYHNLHIRQAKQSKTDD